MSKSHKIRLDKLVSSVLGLCNRSGVKQWARFKHFGLADGAELSSGLRTKVDPANVLLNGKPLEYIEPLTIAMYKPRGFECSRARTSETELIYDLLPPHFFFRNPALVPAGRLDKWASGLLILAQDGKYVQRLCNPKQRQGHPIRTYELELIKPLTPSNIELLGSGRLMLRHEEAPCLPVDVRMLNEQGNRVELTLHEGRYHQIRRMLAVLDNQALSIHRVQIGHLSLNSLNLEPGQWIAMTKDNISQSLVAVKVPQWKKPVDPLAAQQARAQSYIDALAKYVPQPPDTIDRIFDKIDNTPFPGEDEESEDDGEPIEMEWETEDEEIERQLEKQEPFSFI